MKRLLTHMLTVNAILGITSSPEPEYGKPRKKYTDNFGGGYAHNGMYSQAKKIRKGAGHKKLTRAERKSKYGKIH